MAHSQTNNVLVYIRMLAVEHLQLNSAVVNKTDTMHLENLYSLVTCVGSESESIRVEAPWEWTRWVDQICTNWNE